MLFLSVCSVFFQTYLFTYYSNNKLHELLSQRLCPKLENFWALDFCQGQTVQQNSPSVACSGANTIIFACVLVPQTFPFKMLWRAGEGPCVFHSRMSRVHLTFLGNKPTRCNRNAYTMPLLRSLRSR